MRPKLPCLIAGAALVTIGVALIWHAHLWGVIIAVAGLALAHKPWALPGGKPWPQGNGGSSGGGEVTCDGGDSAGDGGGGD